MALCRPRMRWLGAGRPPPGLPVRLAKTGVTGKLHMAGEGEAIAGGLTLGQGVR